jgi:hypothetical protein
MAAAVQFTANSSALSVPLCGADGAVFGALTLYCRDAAAFSGEHLQILQAIQLEFTLALQHALRATTEPAREAGAHQATAPVLAGFLVS